MDIKFPVLTEEERKAKLTIPTGKIHLIIDTDAKNEVDDQFAVSWAIRSPERFEVDAVYAAPYSHDCFRKLSGHAEVKDNVAGITYAEHPGDGMEASYQELLKLYKLLGEKSEGHIFRGSKGYITDVGGPIESDAAKDLIARAMSSDETIYVAAIGAPTNIASALMMEPKLVKKIVVIWLGGQPLYFAHGVEFNLMQDIEASRILFNSGVPLVMIPCMNVASMLSLAKSETEQLLLGKNALCDYLAENVISAYADIETANMMATGFRFSYLATREDRPNEYLFQFASDSVAPSRIIWDIATIAFLKNPNWVLSTAEISPVLNDDMSWGSKNETRHSIRVANFCHRDLIFGDMVKCLTK